MKWSWKLGRFAGVDVYLHFTFLLMLGWFAISDAVAGRSLMAGVWGLGFTVALFASVLLHEYGHALTARRFGVGTRDITLYPIGGVASLERMPDDPKQELWVALAGPAVNVAIAVALYLIAQLTGIWTPLSQLSLNSGSFIERLMLVNISLVIFNLLPAFPMDGGRVLRAILAMRMNYVRATDWAANLGKGMAALFGLMGLFNSPMLLLVAGFVWLAATGEAKATRMKYAWSYAPNTNPTYNDFDAQSHEVVTVPVMRDGHVVGWTHYRRWTNV